MYYYIVVTIENQHCFINKDMDYTDRFSDVLRFNSHEDAMEFIRHHKLQNKAARVIEVIEPTKRFSQ